MNLNPFFSLISTHYQHFGWMGSLVILLGALVSALAYSGRASENYSILNHYISELGEIGVAKRAWAFNAGMILGGTLFLPFIAGLGLTLSSWTGWAGMAAGLLAAVSSIFVGIFSMDRMEPHRKAAMTFFRSGLITILFFTIAVFLQPANQRTIPLAVNIIGIAAIACYSGFLLIVDLKSAEKKEENQNLDPTEETERPRFWRTPFLEWLVFFSTIAWFLCVSLILLA